MTGRADAERVECLRATAEDLREEGSAGELLAAVCYRVSDIYDPAEATTPRDVVVNVRTILRER